MEKKEINVGDIFGNKYMITKILRTTDDFTVLYINLNEAKERSLTKGEFYEFIYNRYQKRSCKDIIDIDFIDEENNGME